VQVIGTVPSMSGAPRRVEQTNGLATVVFVMLAAFAGYRFVYHAVYPILKGIVGSDFAVFQDGARAIVRGTALYPALGQPLSYMYPPTLAIALVPIVDRPGAYFVFMTGAALAVVVAVLLLARFARWDARSVGAFLGVVALSAWPVHLLLRQGQVDSYTLVLMAGALLLVWRARPRAGALCLALAIGLKVTPGVLLLYFLWKKRYQVVVETLLATVALLGVEALVVGPATVITYFVQVVPRIGAEGNPYWYNQSLHATFLRTFTTNEYTEPVVDLGLEFVVVASVVSLLVLVAITLLMVPRDWPARPHVYLAEAGAFIVLEVVGSSLSWHMHDVWLLVPVAALVLAAHEHPDPPAWFLVTVGIALLAFQYGPFEAPFEYGRFAYGWGNLIISHTMWAALLLLALCLYVTRGMAKRVAVQYTVAVGAQPKLDAVVG
jgi:alpha-1,2-mannosyltransferase